MTIHNSWRLRTLCAYLSAGDTVLITELAWTDANGQAINAASSPFGTTPQYTGGENAAAAYDGNTGSWFQANGFPCIGFLNIPTQVGSFSITCHPSYLNRSPVTWVTEYSDDTTTGFDGTWTIASLHTHDFTVQANPFVFNVVGPAATAPYWMVLALDEATSNSQFSASKLEMHHVAGGPDLCSGGFAISAAVYGDNYSAGLAFDGDPSTYFLSHYAQGAYLGYQFPSPVDIGEIEITPRTDGYFYQAPTSMLVACSNNGADWSVRGTVTMPFDGVSAETFSAAVPEANGVITQPPPPPSNGARRRLSYIA